MEQMSIRSTYLEAATQMQRWRDLGSHLVAYLAMNTLFLLIWAADGRGFFWPLFPLIGWGAGLSFQHFNVVLRGQITDAQVRAKLAATESATFDRA